MWQRLGELLGQSDALQIVVLGDFMLDRYLYGDAERISPEAPVPVLRVLREEDAVGGAGSVALDIAALGARPYCVGVSGADADADRLAEMLERSGASTDGLVRVASRRTTRKTRLVGLAQHRHRQQLIRVDDETTEPIDQATAESLMAHIQRRLPDCQALCIEDYDKGVARPDLIRRAIAAAKQRGVPVLVDPASITDYARYQGSSVLTPNRTETERLIGRRLRELGEVREAAPAILAACHSHRVCVTLDADGSALIGPDDGFEHVPTKKRDVYDVTGAGDEVLAAMAVGLAAGGTMVQAAHLANLAGGLEVERFGCVPITRDEVLGEILLEHHKRLGKRRTVEQLLPELARRRAAGERVAFTNGCFDLLHAGHAATFAFCKQHADILVVGLNSDESVRRLNKGPDRPIVAQDHRATLLAAMSDVDYVVLFDQGTPQSLIEAVKPDVLVKGGDWKDKPIAGRKAVEAHGGEVLFAPLVEGLSTSRILERICGRS